MSTSFSTPTWSAQQQAYLIQVKDDLAKDTLVPLARDTTGSVTFADQDNLLDAVDTILHTLLADGEKYKWFAKLPTHEQLMKRAKHTFSALPTEDQNTGLLTSIWLTPKQLTFVWRPEATTSPAPPLEFEESDAEGLGDDEESEEDVAVAKEIPESNLPPMNLKDEDANSRERYLLARLRAAKARVEAEQVRMMYFEETGKMPPDSETEDEDSE